MLYITCLSGLSLNRVSEIRYLGFFIVKSRYFKCSLDYAKRSFYRAANAFFGIIGRIASEEFTLQAVNCYIVDVCACFVIWSRSLSLEHF